ncbi:hypothetical protein [Aridibaculum aurantiacum]|uniref:hypothetical protein n=1 Tax=Aridibaculum aurantiacum TaxID=2810307 RepID=UPI001A958131|nr:hypothetical protein [Aridibaculum aurantiacum]
MKKLYTFLLMCLLVSAGYAQKVDFKNGIIKVDGNDWAKMTVLKTNFGLTKTFEVFSLSGEKLIIAAPATEFEADKSDNSMMYYRLTFLTSNQVGIFRLAALSQEKSFLKLITSDNILEGNVTSDSKVKELIAMRGASPTIAVDYTLVRRDKIWPVDLKQDRTIEQEGKIIGNFVPKGGNDQVSYYEFKIPSGVLVARVSFTGGNNAQNFELFTAKDNLKRVIPLPQNQKILAASADIDQYQFTVKRIAKWLVDNSYL